MRKRGMMTIRLLTRTEIRNIARELDFRPRKAYGQNFVHDANTSGPRPESTRAITFSRSDRAWDR